MTAADRVVIARPVNRPADAERAESLAGRLGLELVDEDRWKERGDLALVFEDGRLALCDRDTPRGRGVATDFGRVPIRHGQVQVSRQQPLGRVFGAKVETIVDATAGLGRDSFLLACMGYDVTSIERSPVVAALLRNGHARALADGRLRAAVGGNWRIVEADACAWLASLLPEECPDAVYLDPMFPPKRKKSALAKKAIRLVRRVVGEDPDAEALFEAAARAARVRVVVKRADDAPPLVPRPTASVTGKLVRYDLYAPASAGQLAGQIRIG